MTALKHMLVPHNLSDMPETAVQHARAIAKALGAKLHLFHVSGQRGGDIATDDVRVIDRSTEDAGDGPRPNIGAPAGEKRRTIPRSDTLDGFTDELSACEGVSLLDLEPLTTLVVHTRHSVYRIIVLQDTTVRIQGGPFPDGTIGHLNGSGFGGHLLKLGWIGVGLRMEISSHGKRFITSAVRTITTECNPPMHRPQ